MNYVGKRVRNSLSSNDSLGKKLNGKTYVYYDVYPILT